MPIRSHASCIGYMHDRFPPGGSKTASMRIGVFVGLSLAKAAIPGIAMIDRCGYRNQGERQPFENLCGLEAIPSDKRDLFYDQTGC